MKGASPKNITAKIDYQTKHQQKELWNKALLLQFFTTLGIDLIHKNIRENRILQMIQSIIPSIDRNLLELRYVIYTKKIVKGISRSIMNILISSSL